MKKQLLTILMFVLGVSAQVRADDKLIDLCEKNTSSTYKEYSTATTIAAGSTLTVRTARYTDFYPTLSGKGNLELYCGGERTYLGKHSDKSYPNWTNFTGHVDIYPYKAVEANCGFYGAVMNTNGKSYSPEDANPTSKINVLFNNNKVVLHEGAAFATEKSAAGIRIGELNTEAGSRMYGYYKSQSANSTAYYLLGGLHTDATLAGRIASVEKNGAPDATQAVGIVKEGKGTYTLTANDNQISGAIRINEGKVLINNDAATAKRKKYTGGTGSAGNASMPVVYVFKGTALGGNGNIGGHVDLYGSLMPGHEGQGTLYLANYATSAACHLIVHPGSSLHFSITDASAYTSMEASGSLQYNSMLQDFTEGKTQPQVVVTLSENQQVKEGDTFTLIKAAKGREHAADWKFRVVLPEQLTWDVNETEENGQYVLSVTCTSLNQGNQGGEDEKDNMDDKDEDEEDDSALFGEVAGTTVQKGMFLRKYLEMLDTDKRIGVAVPSTWTYNVPANPSSTVSKNISNNFNLCVAENEMKIDQIEPSQNGFNFGAANDLVQYAQNQQMAVRGHTLVWHQQVPEWISKDGKNNDKKWTRDQLLEIMKNHITKCVKQFGSKVMEWDVVNETLDDDQSIVRTQPNGYQLRKESVWVKVIGEDFIDSAFVYAHRANPNLKLYLNDYDCEFSGVAKTTALYNLAKRLKDKGIPIDGVGLQCHLKVNNFSKSKLNQTVKRYAEIGLNCIFTEIDIAISSISSSELTKQAEVFSQIAEVWLKNDNCPHMVVWGINDKYSWVSGSHAVLFDENNTGKPAYKAVQTTLRNYVANKKLQTSVGGVGDAHATEVDRYSLSGLRLTTPTKGVSIVRMSDGSVKKVME